MRLGALEAGGTKMVCAVGDDKGHIYKQTSIPTETPEITLPKLIDFFRDEKIESLGIGCFGPIDLNQQSDTYGYIMTTPKQAWAYCDIVGAFKKALGCPVGFDTDVNGSVLGEVTFGQAKGKKHVIYITIGTGIGAGIYAEGTLLHGMMHPEAGHLLLRKRQDDMYEGNCPYHKNCFEGMAAGPAIEKRWGEKAVLLHDRAEVWDLEAWYIAQALADYIMILSPEQIILGGGVMHQEQLFSLIRSYVREMLAGYIGTAQINDLEHYIVPASLDDKQGVLGCLELARRAAN